MRVPLLDLSQQYASLLDPIQERVAEVLRSQRFILGPYVTRFENAARDFIGAHHAIGVSSGTDALLAVYMALGLGPGDAVLTSAYSFFATASCVSRVGARPVFLDIEPDTYNLSPERLREFVTRDCERKNGRLALRTTGEIVRAIVPVHLFGACCDMDALPCSVDESTK